VNVWKLSLFLLLLNLSLYVVGEANIPIRCDSAGTSCLYFNVGTIGTTTLSDIMEGNVDDSSYKAVQIEAEVTADMYTATATAISKAGQSIVFSLYCVYSIVVFIMGYSPVGVAIAVTLQAGVYFFYSYYVISLVKESSGDIGG